MLRQLSLLVPISALALSLPAQALGEVVGLTSITPRVNTITVTAPLPTCQVAFCTPQPLFEKRNPNDPWNGGTAWDGRLAGAWITNGTQIANVDPRNKCAYLCPPQPMPVTMVGDMCTGLAFVESGAPLPAVGLAPLGTLFASYASANLGRIDVSAAGGACKFKAAYCRMLIMRGHFISGLAVDDVDRILFVGISNFNTAQPNSFIQVHPIDGPNWCQPICTFKIPPCPNGRMLGHIQGLAFDVCKKTLFITDGRMTMYGTFQYRDPTGKPVCLFKPMNCCSHWGTNVEPVTGLAFMPTRTLSVGQSCTVKTCNNCPTMVAGVNGNPVLGNRSFALTLKNAPSNASLGALAIGFGPCNNVGVNLGLCGTLKVFTGPPPALAFVFGMIPSGLGCNAGATLPAPIPLSLSLCGLKVSLQWAVACKAAIGPGNGVTNCVTIEVST